MTELSPTTGPGHEPPIEGVIAPTDLLPHVQAIADNTGATAHNTEQIAGYTADIAGTTRHIDSTLSDMHTGIEGAAARTETAIHGVGDKVQLLTLDTMRMRTDVGVAVESLTGIEKHTAELAADVRERRAREEESLRKRRIAEAIMEAAGTVREGGYVDSSRIFRLPSHMGAAPKLTDAERESVMQFHPEVGVVVSDDGNRFMTLTPSGKPRNSAKSTGAATRAKRLYARRDDGSKDGKLDTAHPMLHREQRRNSAGDLLFEPDRDDPGKKLKPIEDEVYDAETTVGFTDVPPHEGRRGRGVKDAARVVHYEDTGEATRINKGIRRRDAANIKQYNRARRKKSAEWQRENPAWRKMRRGVVRRAAGAVSRVLLPLGVVGRSDWSRVTTMAAAGVDRKGRQIVTVERRPHFLLRDGFGDYRRHVRTARVVVRPKKPKK